AVLALQRYVDRASCVVAQEYVRERERQLLAQRRSTEEAMLRYTRLAESGIIGIFVCDFFGNITETNDCLLNLLGYSREELLQTSWVALTPPEWRAYDEDAKTQLIAHGRSRSWEKEYIRKDGTRVPVVVGVAMLTETEGVAFVLDITERKRLDELRVRSQELEAQNVRMREANRIQGEFLANMSHELRTPLNSIIGFSELLHAEEIVVDPAHQREFLGDILKSGRHLLQLIDDVLDLAKVESGKLDFWPEPIQLEPVVSEVCAMLRTWAAERRITLGFAIDPVVDHVTLDPSRLKQVLYNYVSNGLKFTGAGGTVQVRVRAEATNSIRIEVADTGIGIAEHDLERLFAEFQQLDAGRAKKHAGTGLGLVLTKRIVEAQGGKVGVTSVLGQGSVFFAVLPAHMEQQTVDAASASARVATPAGGAVLVVDDDPRDRTSLVGMLAEAGYAAEAACSGQEALAQCRQKRFAAILLNTQLPDLDELEVLQQLTKRSLNGETPVIVVSVAEAQDLVGALSVHDRLSKPVRSEELLASLGRAGVHPGARPRASTSPQRM
ncbi:MAG: hypothetical protein RLZZ450_6448, partial [Pseudomonadota bacterium]